MAETTYDASVVAARTILDNTTTNVAMNAPTSRAPSTNQTTSLGKDAQTLKNALAAFTVGAKVGKSRVGGSTDGAGGTGALAHSVRQPGRSRIRGG